MLGNVICTGYTKEQIENIIRKQNPTGMSMVLPEINQCEGHIGFDGSEPMSIICTYVSDVGIIVASDSRRVKIFSDGRVEYLDNEQKIFSIPNTNILVGITGGCRFGDSDEWSCKDIIPTVHETGIKDAGNEIARCIIQYGAKSDSRVILYQPTIKGNTLVSLVYSVLVGTDGTVDCEYGMIPQGHIFSQGSDEARRLINCFWTYKMMPLGMAVANIKSCIDDVILSMGCVHDGIKTVGGKCDLYVATLNGIEHILI